MKFSISKLAIVAASILFMFVSLLNAQDNDNRLLSYWNIGDKYYYRITMMNVNVGSCVGEFIGKVNHEKAGDCFQFATITKFDPKFNIQITSNLYTQKNGYPVAYDAKYNEGKSSFSISGFPDEHEFIFREKKDTLTVQEEVNISPLTLLCDKQCIPHWNLAFYNCPDFGQDTIIFNVLIPYLKKRTFIKMFRQEDQKLDVLGIEINCLVYFSPRTDEFYYITPDKKVARVFIPSQEATYNLTAIEKPKKPEIEPEK